MRRKGNAPDQPKMDGAQQPLRLVPLVHTQTKRSAIQSHRIRAIEHHADSEWAECSHYVVVRHFHRFPRAVQPSLNLLLRVVQPHWAISGEVHQLP